MTRDLIRWGICGTGRIAAEFVESLTNVEDAVVVAVGSNTPGRAFSFAARHGIERHHDSYDLLSEDDGVDVVYVASTQERHVDDTLLFLRAGCHVLCEKPFALSLVDAVRMTTEAARADRFLMEAMWSRFLPSYIRLGELLADGVIGEPRLLEANFSFRVADDEIDGHRLFDPHRGGGALLDLGVYPVQLAHLVFGAPASVHATARLSERGIDEQTALLLGYGEGRAALLHAAVRTAGTCGARLAGDDGVLELAPHMHCTSKLTLTRHGTTEVFDFPRASLHFQVHEVHRCLREGRLESDRMPHSETLAIMATLDAALTQIGVEYPARDS